MPRVMAAIRTHKWTEEEDRALAMLRPVFGTDIAVVFHNRPSGLQPPVDVIDIDNATMAKMGLRTVPDWGWRCGDYFYYALRQARPDYAHYWLVEPDLLITGDAAKFFELFADSEADVIGKKIEPFEGRIPFTRGLPGIRHYRSIFCLTRFSGRALDRLFPLRQAYSKTKFGPHLYTNDEIFTFSNAVADPGMTTASMTDIAPYWFASGQCDTNPDILLDALLGTAAGNSVFHPVRGRTSFKGAVANRLAANDGFLRNMHTSLAWLTDEDLDDIVAQSAKSLHAALLKHRGQMVRTETN